MTHKFDQTNKSKLDNDWRRQNLPPYETLKELGLSENDVAADIGCGIGYFSIPIAEIIKSGNVYALDISSEMLAEVERRASVLQLINIITAKTEEYDLKLPDDTVSFSLLVNVLHEVNDKIKFVKEIKRITKENGKIAIIEWEKKETEMGPPIQHRLDSITVKTILMTLGFEIKKETAFAGCFYGIVGVMKVK